jgi:hypothetical protein
MGRIIRSAVPAALLPLQLALLLLLILAAGCTSLSEEEAFLSRLSDPVKARAVTEEGIVLYQLALLKRGEYEQVGEVRRYFEIALRFDPTNRQAQAYLELVDNYRDAERRKRLNEAEALLKKGKRSQEEDYALCVAVARAGQLAPEDSEVEALRSRTAETRDRLVSLYLSNGREARSRAQEEPAAAAREKLYLEAFGSFSRALAVEPESSSARSEKDSLLAAVNAIMTERLDGAGRLAAQGKFAEARIEAALVEELNRRLGHPLDDELAELNYTLNYGWARSLLERREYPAALTRVDAALAWRRTEEAAALRARILQARQKSQSGVSYEAALGEADRQLAEGDLAGAFGRLSGLARGTKDRARLAALEARRQKIRGQLPALYEKAVAFYRADDFGKAAELLETVVAIDVEYEQAAEYLGKARSKQKLLEQYGAEGW